MKVIIKEDYQQMSELAAKMILAKMYMDKRVNLSLTAGKTPAAVYTLLAAAVKAEPTLLENVYFYNFDEFAPKNDPFGETHRELLNVLYQPLGVVEDHIHHYSLENYQQQEKVIADAGGLDLMLLGLGADGHFCGNLPGTTLFTEYSYKFKIEKTAPWYANFEAILGDQIPDEMVTMGAPSIMKAKQVILIINGQHKAAAVKRFFQSDVDANFPATILKLHPNLTVILDKEAAELL